MHLTPRFLRVSLPTLLIAALGVVGCSSPSEPEVDRATFVVEVSGETFLVEVVGSVRIAQLEDRLASGSRGVINGELIRGSGGFNQGWSWHLDPATVEAVDASIELCDGRPSMVEADLDYWVDTVGRFCPWGAKVIERASD